MNQKKTTNTESPPPEQFTATSLSHQTTGTVFLQTAMIPTLVNGETTLPYQPEKSSSYSSESFCNVMSKLTNIFLHARLSLRLSSIFQILSSPIRHLTHLLESTCSLELNFMKPSRIKENNNITYCDSLFGWVVIGGSPSVSIQTLTTCLSSLSSIPEEETLKKCWEIEDLPQGHHFTKEEHACEQHLQQTTTRNEDGLFIVKLPFKEDTIPLGDSFRQAKRRLETLLYRLSKNESLYTRYAAFIKEFFLDLGTMEKIPESEYSNRNQQIILSATPLCSQGLQHDNQTSCGF